MKNKVANLLAFGMLINGITGGYVKPLDRHEEEKEIKKIKEDNHEENNKGYKER